MNLVRAKNTLKINIRGGKFVSWIGDVKEFRSDFVEGCNGWKVKYYSDGSIRAKANFGWNEYGEDAVQFKISRFGYVCLSEIHNGEKKEIRRLKLKKWPDEGTLALTDGGFGTRYAYFQDSAYRKFLLVNRIYALRREDPNQSYTLYECFSEELQKNIRETICTDGQIVEIGQDYGRSDDWERENPDTSSFEKYQEVEVRGATWVIIKREDFDEETSRRTLYSQLQFEELTNNIPRE